LGTAYILIGGLSLVYSLIFLLMYVMKPRWGKWLHILFSSSLYVIWFSKYHFHGWKYFVYDFLFLWWNVYCGWTLLEHQPLFFFFETANFINFNIVQRVHNQDTKQR
jgi:hypothetical protein